MREISGNEGSPELIGGLRVDARARGPVEAAAQEVERTGGAVLLLPVRVEQDAVAEDGDEELLDVLRLHERAALRERPCAGGALERERAPHRCADVDGIEVAGRADEADQPVLED